MIIINKEDFSLLLGEHALELLADAALNELLRDDRSDFGQSFACALCGNLGTLDSSVEELLCVLRGLLLVIKVPECLRGNLLAVVRGSGVLVLACDGLLLEAVVLLEEVPEALVASELNDA